MKKSMLYIALLLLTFLGGMWVAKSIFLDTKTPETDAIILQQQIRKVCKLVSVEGSFVEYYDYGDPDPGPIFIGPLINFDALWPTKTARMRIKATVSVGYDLEQLNIKIDDINKTVEISNMPKASIVSIEHKLDFFDKDDTWLNPFTNEDMVKMDNGAKAAIRKAAKESGLLETAEKQGNDIIEIIRFICKSSGFALIETNLPFVESDQTKLNEE